MFALITSCLLALPGAAPAKAVNANSQLQMNAAGTMIATVSGSRNVEIFSKNSDGFWYGPTAVGGNARSDSPVVTDAAGDEVAFIDSATGDVELDTLANGAWTGPVAIGGTARAGSSLAISGDGSRVVFFDATSHITNDWLSGGAWAGPSDLGGEGRSDSPVAINNSADHVFYVDPAGDVVNDYVTGGAWVGPSPLGGTARAGSSMATNTAGSIVAFIDPSGYVVNDWYASGWQGPAEMGGTAEADSPLALDGAPDHVFFLNTSGDVVNDYVSNGTWTGPSGIGGTAVSGSGLSSAAGTGSAGVAFFTSAGLSLDWYSAGWHGPGYPDTIPANIRGIGWPSESHPDGLSVITGLTTTETPAQAESDAAAIAGNLFADTGGNTVRIPIDTPTVSSSTYWPIYVAAIQGILSRGNAILVFGNSGGTVPKNGGTAPDMTAFYDTWDTVINQFGGNKRAFFEPLNEPYGYSTSDLVDLYNQWLNRYSSIPRQRVLLDGTGYADHVGPIGAAVSGTLLSLHDYPNWFPTSTRTESEWGSQLDDELGGYANRTVVTEWGAPENTGLNYDTTGSSNLDIRFIRGISARIRSLGTGSVFWVFGAASNGFSLYTLPSGTSPVLVNQSALDRLKYSFEQ